MSNSEPTDRSMNAQGPYDSQTGEGCARSVVVSMGVHHFRSAKQGGPEDTLAVLTCSGRELKQECYDQHAQSSQLLNEDGLTAGFVQVGQRPAI